MATDKTFDFKRYSAPTDAHENHSLEDGSDALANRGFAISFQHLPSGKSVYFKAFITQFNEAYAPDWAAETVYGRADPIYFFKNTTRSISLGFKIPAASEGEAYENLARVQKLVQFLYPAYVDVQNANTISQSPLVRLKVMNLLEKSTVGLASRGPTEIQTYGEYRSTNDPSKGLLGVISSVAINHNLEDDASGVFEKAENTILPRLIDITMEFKPIHEHTVGWDESGEFADNTSFPYGAPSILAAADDQTPADRFASEDEEDVFKTDEERAAEKARRAETFASEASLDAAAENAAAFTFHAWGERAAAEADELAAQLEWDAQRRGGTTAGASYEGE